MPPKLTPEERKALRAQKKAEKKRLKIEKQKQLKRDYLGREIKYGALTIKRHEKEWREMLIKIALPKVREDLEFAWHNFERVIDCKNFTISLLMDEVKEAEEQYMLNVRTHMENIDKLIDLFREQIEELQSDYENEVTKLQKRSEEEAEEIKLAATEEENYLKTMVYILEVARKEQKQNVRAEYFSKLEEEDKKNSQHVNRLRGVLENKFHYIMKDTLRFLSDYKNRTKERRKDHNELKTQDDALQELLVSQLEKIRKACDYVKILRVKLSDSQKVLGRKLNDVEAERDFFHYAFSTLKKRLEIDTKKDVQQITLLTVNYNETIEYLEKLKEKVEGILHVGAVCRKLETQAEKIRPFPVNIVTDTSATDIEDVEEYLPSLDLFWQRVAQADASRFAINEEKEFLKTENAILKIKLHQYCECITCPVPEKSLIGKGRHVTEGALELEKYAKQNVPQFSSSVYHCDIDE